MTDTMYLVYARRVGENNWTDWCRVANLERAMEHCENERRCGMKISQLLHAMEVLVARIAQRLATIRKQDADFFLDKYIKL